MQVTSLLRQHEHDDMCGCGHDHEHSIVHLCQAVLGVVFVLNAFIVDWVFDSGSTDRKSTRLNSSHANISYAAFCLKTKKSCAITALTETSPAAETWQSSLRHAC